MESARVASVTRADSHAVDELVHSTGATGVRIRGDRVHRTAGPWTPAVHALLAHARAAGFLEAPEVLEVDAAAGEEVVRYVPGELGAPDHLTDARLVAVGHLVRRLDDVLATFPRRPDDDRRWRAAPCGDVVAHGDVAPWNLVFDGDEVAGLLDWDFAGLAPAGTDLAYAAWTCVPLTADTGFTDDELAARLRTLVDAHGAPHADGPERLLEVLAVSQARVLFDVARGGAAGQLGLPGIWRGGRKLGDLGRGMAWLDERWERFLEALR